MRLPEAKIKEALAHPDKLVRQEALLYFADCHSRDAEVMPLAIQAVETYGRSNAFLHVHVLAQLAQTEATVEWAVKELHREVDKAHDLDSYFPALSRLLCSADPQLLTPRADEILKAPGFFKELAPEFKSGCAWPPGTPTSAGRNWSASAPRASASTIRRTWTSATPAGSWRRWPVRARSTLTASLTVSARRSRTS